MKIILTNDDGIYAPGLWALFDRIAVSHEVVVIAPDRERSAVGHGITLNRPLRADMVEVCNGYKGYAVSGTPADCIKLGLTEIKPFEPDMVISGINPGSNVGIDINYSGTVAAAREAAFYGIPAVAVSAVQHDNARFKDAAKFIESLITKINGKTFPTGILLNVNMPDLPLSEVAGVRISRQGIGKIREAYEKRTDPQNREYFWPSGGRQIFHESLDVDGYAVNDNYISISPLKFDATDYAAIDTLKEWEIDT